MHDWLYAFALALPASVMLASVGLALHARARRAEAVVATVMAALALGTLILAAGAAIDVSRISFLNLDGYDFISRLATGVLLSSALVLGAVVAVGSVLAAKNFSAQQHGPGLKLMAAIPIVTFAVTALLLAIVDRQTQPPLHPTNVQSGTLASAVLVAGDLRLPTGLAAASDGIVFWAENESSSLRVAVPEASGGYSTFEFAAMADVEAEQPYHIVLHPRWPAEPYVYVSSTYEGEDDELFLGVFRFRHDELRGEEGERLVGGLPPGPAHVGSALAFCDEYLYFSVGDNDLSTTGDGPRNLAQDPREPHGKILRYRLDGIDLEPAGVLASDPPVFAMGFRNVFGMDCAVDRQIPVVADNGRVGNDHVKFVAPGSNHEWPITETRDALATPLFTSGPTSIGVSGVAWISATNMLLATVNPESVYALHLDDSGALATATVYFEVEGPAVAITRGADNCTYVADTSRIWRIVDDGCP